MMHLALFGAEIFQVAPPECVHPSSTFYTRLLLFTLGPVVVIVVMCAIIIAHSRRQHAEEAAEYAQRMCISSSLCFLELMLTGIALVICKTFVCETIEGMPYRVLTEQPTLSCATSAVRTWWVSYAWIMFVVYPIGVPLFIFVLLHYNRATIRRIMTIRNAIECGFDKGE